jgi:NAD(P)-dependent dehydrogenase (short-subunit alcohol dehydrogenase family)
MLPSPLSPLNPKIALVTGATRGLGKGIAIGLGEAGATVYITGRTVQATGSGSLAETQQAVEQAGGVCIPIQVDHRDDGQIQALFERIQAEQGQLDILVNNVYSGVQALRTAHGIPFWKAEPDLWDACNQVGLRGHYIASVLAARMMVPRQQGLICTISSWGGLAPIFGVAYGAGKAGCDRMAADMAVELKGTGVTALSVWPGIVGTEQISQFATEVAPDTEDPRSAMIRQQYNWETPLLTGRVIAALAADARLHRRAGRVQIVAELARHYGLTDEAGHRPASLRSLRFLLPYRIPALQRYARLIPDWRIPWPLLLLTALSSPQVSG